MTTRKQQAKAATGPRVYCGPSIRGIAKQYTVFAGELPPALSEKAQAVPALASLIVPLERFADTRLALSNPESAEAAIYREALKKI